MRAAERRGFERLALSDRRCGGKVVRVRPTGGAARRRRRGRVEPDCLFRSWAQGFGCCVWIACCGFCTGCYCGRCCRGRGEEVELELETVVFFSCISSSRSRTVIRCIDELILGRRAEAGEKVYIPRRVARVCRLRVEVGAADSGELSVSADRGRPELRKKSTRRTHRFAAGSSNMIHASLLQRHRSSLCHSALFRDRTSESVSHMTRVRPMQGPTPHIGPKSATVGHRFASTTTRKKILAPPARRRCPIAC